MDTKVKAAMARVRKNTGSYAEMDQLAEDTGLLSAAFLTEHPADDDEPVTEEWASATGLLNVDMDSAIENAMNKPGIDGQPPEFLNTRGKLRRFMACLGVLPPPKET